MSDTPAESARQVVKEVVRDNTVGTDLPGVRRVIRWDLFTARLEIAIAAELERKDERIRELEQKYCEAIKWANCGGAPTGKTCAYDPRDVHEIYGPFFSDDAEGTNPVCQTHALRRLEQANKELLYALERIARPWLRSGETRAEAARAAVDRHTTKSVTDVAEQSMESREFMGGTK